MNNLTKFVYFIFGVGVGFGLGKIYTDKVYGKRIKAYLKTVDTSKEPPKKRIPIPTKVDESKKEPTDDILVGKPEASDPVDPFRTAYDKVIAEHLYSANGMIRKSKYQIDEDEYGNDPAYATMTLRYFQDTSELIDPMGGDHFDVDLTLGEDSTAILDKADPYQMLYFRNEDLMTDYDIEIGELDE